MARTIRQSWYIHTNPKNVYKALTDPKVLTTWFLKSARFPRQPEENYHFKWLGGYEASAKVLKLQKDKLVSLQWPQHSKSGRFLGNTTVTFTIERKTGGTLLRVEHAGYGDSDGWIENYALTHSGWAYYLMNMKSVLQNGVDLRAENDDF